MNLQTQYKKEILPQLMKDLACGNINEVPKIVKIVINVGFGKTAKEKAYIDNVVSTLERISGQKAVLTKAKKSIASFKVREGMIIGSMVTLRGARMWDFLEKLIKVVFSNIKDFRGVSPDILDNKGNLTVGFREHVIFPEIRHDEIDKIHGLEVSINTTAKDKAAGLALFTLLGFPFKKS
ncbi:MAG: 50S ribosomal protein L5 [Candidatus Falkowbacteria bacterium]|nr:50S ribosomal protein L5 [Candidatus Falkowbacteria bacterium]